MRRVGRAGLIAASLALPIGAAFAWAPQTRVKMIDEAVRLMPASLRIALEAHREPLLRGMLEPLLDEDAPRHRPPWAGGSLDAAVAEEAAALEQVLGRPGPFNDLARQFGVLAHYVADAGFPPGAGAVDDERYRHFGEFCESRRERFPLVFYGHDDERLARGAFGEFALHVLGRAREDDVLLAAAYAAAGNPPAPAAFDDRSIPFAIGSLAYSRSINDIVKTWLAAWEHAAGDLGRTPYRAPAAASPPVENP